MRHFIFFLIVAILISACNGSSKKSDTPETIKQTLRNVPPVGYYSLNGHIHQTKVFVNLHITEQGIRGSYTDENTGVLVHVFSIAYRPTEDSIILLASPYRAVQDVYSGEDTLVLAYQKESFKGYRKTSGDAPQAVEWKIISDDSVLSFEPIRIKDSVVMTEGPAAYIDVEMIAPHVRTSDTKSATLHQWIVQFGLPELKSAPEKTLTAAQSYVSGYLNDFKASMQRAITSTDMDFTLPVYQYQQQRIMSVLYNRKNILVLSNYIFDYSGGAHPNHVTYIRCFDMKQEKVIQWDDVFKVAPEAMSDLMEAHFRLTRGIKPDEPLKSVLFEDKIIPNKNFYITHAGIGFWYVPYEIAAYVYGDTEVFIPYSALQPFLKEDFLKTFE
ncbi:MAG: DUF3298 domain-containing protein [Ferruginibacter sp.]|nr:DUF3298 domain-containing protein [Ferruginibacter sp.]